MFVKNFVEKDKYYDSVFLMKLARNLVETGIAKNASVGMGTPLNKETMSDLKLLCEEGKEASPNDLIIAVSADTEEKCDLARDEFFKLLEEKAKSGNERKFRSIQGVKTIDPNVNLAIISVAGEYAAKEAEKALLNGLNVFMFSDNVPLEDEIRLKKLAEEKNLLMMGPGCGLSFINGVAIGLCSMVRRGNIGLVGASGSGIQTVMTLVHKYGFGISNAIGTGGRDMSDEVGGITMLRGIRELENDPETKVIALISKPPAKSTLIKVVEAVKKCKKKIVIQFINGDNDYIRKNGILCSESFEETAKMVMELASGKKIELKDDTDYADIAEVEMKKYAPSQKYFRSILCGGSLADEGLVMLEKSGIETYSNVAFDNEHALKNPFESYKNTVIDIGDENFTKGRAHVAIDPSVRVQRFIKEARDPETAVIYLDFLLGYALCPDPASVMAEAIKQEKKNAVENGRHLTVIATICGSDMDPQGYDDQYQKLTDAGVIFKDTNRKAVKLIIEIAKRMEEK